MCTRIAAKFLTLACPLSRSIPLTRWFDTPEVVFGDTTQAFAVAALCLLMDVCAFTGRGVLLGIERKGRGGIVYLVAEYAAGRLRQPIHTHARERSAADTNELAIGRCGS